jgi:hypothetical protein
MANRIHPCPYFDLDTLKPSIAQKLRYATSHLGVSAIAPKDQWEELTEACEGSAGRITQHVLGIGLH